MTRRKDPVLPPRPLHQRTADGRAGGAFDVWLQRGLHQLFDGIAREPIPEELLRIIEDDRQSAGNTAESTATPDSPAKPERT